MASLTGLHHLHAVCKCSYNYKFKSQIYFNHAIRISLLCIKDNNNRNLYFFASKAFNGLPSANDCANRITNTPQSTPLFCCGIPFFNVLFQCALSQEPPTFLSFHSLCKYPIKLLAISLYFVTFESRKESYISIVFGLRRGLLNFYLSLSHNILFFHTILQKK
eukprot:1005141_1